MLMNIKAAKGAAGTPRDYDLRFMDNGVLFNCTAGGLKSNLKASVGSQFGAVGAVLTKGSLDKDKQAGRDATQRLTPKQMLEKNDKSIYLP